MNCWFCNNPIGSPNLNNLNVYCGDSKCEKYYVNYDFDRVHHEYTYNLLKVQIRTTLNDYKYIINYWINQRKMNILYQKDEAALEYAIRTHYDSIILTPSNVDTKLPLYLLLI